MGGKTDIAKGRVKEAGGVLTGDDKLRNEGKKDQAVGHVKEAVEDVKKGKGGQAADHAREAGKKAKDSAR